MTIYGFRREVVCYVTRSSPGRELLVVEHTDDAPASPSVQVPAGGMQPFESLAAAAVRLVAEETGLTGLTYVDQVGYVERGPNDPGGPAVVNFVHLEAAPGGSAPAGADDDGGGTAANDDAGGTAANDDAGGTGGAGGSPWQQTVTGDGQDARLAFRCRWEPLPLRGQLGADQGTFLGSLGAQ